MRIKDSILARRNTLLFISLFSCVQIILGFFLIMGQSSNIAPPIQHAKFTFKDINNMNFLSNDLKVITKIASINTHSIHTD